MTNQDQKISTCLWFDEKAKEAAEFYTSLFNNSRIGKITHYGREGQEIHGKPEGAEMAVEFEIEDQKFLGLNGGPGFQFNPSISFYVGVVGEENLNTLWENLSEGGRILMALDKYDWSDKYGWLEDRYGVNWQLMLDEKNNLDQKICPLLFFTGEQQGRAEEAVNFYTSIFKKSSIEGLLLQGEENSNAKNTVKHAQFKLVGQTFMAMDGGPENNHPFNQAVSLVVSCETQEEIDYYWEHLSEGGDEKAQQCGWLKDKFGVSWQIVPAVLKKMLGSENPSKKDKVTKAFLQMKKFDINKLKEAFDS